MVCGGHRYRTTNNVLLAFVDGGTGGYFDVGRQTEDTTYVSPELSISIMGGERE